jgi:hypothetical protein
VVISLRTVWRHLGTALAATLTAIGPCAAQVTPAGGPPTDDTPSIKVGVTMFVDYTVNEQPKIRDADGNEVTFSAFQIGRSYINVMGNITRNVSFRITPDVARETGVGSALNGSYTFRLKFAYLEWNLDKHLPPGSFARFGMQQNPYHEMFDALYRYRFQGTLFVEREGYIASADAGAVFRYSFPGNYGDVQTGFFNGENFSRFEVNDQKSFRTRGTVRPLPSHATLRGLRFTGYYDKDAYVKNADRTRAMFTGSFEHRYVNGAFEYLATRDQTSAARTPVDGRAWSVFVTPRTTIGWEGLIRFDHTVPDKAIKSQVRERAIAGVAYWFPQHSGVTTALMLDVDNATFDGFSPAQATQRRIALHALVNF